MPARRLADAGADYRVRVAHAQLRNETAAERQQQLSAKPILTEKAFPENEFLIVPAVSHLDEDPAPSIIEASVVALYERRFGKRSMVEIEVPLITTNALATWTSGIGDLALAFKHVIFATQATDGVAHRSCPWV